MKCSLLTLSCALDAELSKERQAELEAHLVTCERCRTGMRYLREETERISQLVRVTVPTATATALLERAKVIVTVHPGEDGPSASPGIESAVMAGDLTEPGRDPFNLMGIGTHAIEVTEQEPEFAAEAPAPSLPLPGDEPASSAAERLSSESEVAPPSFPSPGAVTPAVGPILNVPDPPSGDWLISVNGTPRQARADPSGVTPGTDGPTPGSHDVSEVDEPPGPGTSGTVLGRAEVTAEEIGPTPVFMPLPGPLLDQDGQFDDTEEMSREQLPAVKPAASASPFVLPQETLNSRSSTDPTTPAPDGETPDQAEMMQVALEESAILEGEEGTGSPDAVLRSPELPPPSGGFEAAWIPPPPSIQKAQDAGWKPNANLNLGLNDIAAAKPQMDALAASTDPEPPRLRGPLSVSGTRPARSDFAPVRPAAAGALSGARSPIGGRAPEPRHRAPGGRGRPAGGGGAATPRSWTKTATIAIAALAVFLIGWTLTHHSSTPPSQGSRVTSPSGSKPTPASTPTPPVSTAPAITLSGTQSFGTNGSGYQVQNARYGLHQNGTQLWVVFQLGAGSGAPHITTGFDGAQTLYVEMQGVAPGATVAQPPSGELVTSVQPGQVPGFSGAVYVLQLSRAAQVSGYLLPGSPTGSAGERVVLQLQ